jgi:hypothetical protein
MNLEYRLNFFIHIAIDKEMIEYPKPGFLNHSGAMEKMVINRFGSWPGIFVAAFIRVCGLHPKNGNFSSYRVIYRKYFSRTKIYNLFLIFPL